MGNEQSFNVLETRDFDVQLKNDIFELITKSFDKICTLYRVSTIKNRELSFFLDTNGTLREIKTGDLNTANLSAGFYTQTFLSGHSHYPTDENVDGPSGEDLFSTTGQVHDKLCIGEMILCPDKIWVLIPSPNRVNAFSHDTQWKFYEIGYGSAINKQYRLGRMSINQYLDALYDIGFDVLVIQKHMVNC